MQIKASVFMLDVIHVDLHERLSFIERFNRVELGGLDFCLNKPLEFQVKLLLSWCIQSDLEVLYGACLAYGCWQFEIKAVVELKGWISSA